MTKINYLNPLQYRLMASDIKKISHLYYQSLINKLTKEGLTTKYSEKYARDLSSMSRLEDLATRKINKLGETDLTELLPILNLSQDLLKNQLFQIQDGFQAKQIARETSINELKKFIMSKTRYPAIVNKLENKSLNYNLFNQNRKNTKLYELKEQLLLVLLLPYMQKHNLQLKILDQTAMIQLTSNIINDTYNYLNISNSDKLHLLISNYQSRDADKLAKKFNQIKVNDNYHIVVLSLLTTYQLHQGIINL